MSDEERVEKTWQEFWVPIVLSEDGTLNVEQAKRELSDYADIMDSVSEVYGELTGGRFTKPNTAPLHILDRVRELEEQDRAELEKRIKELEGQLAELVRSAKDVFIAEGWNRNTIQPRDSIRMALGALDKAVKQAEGGG